MKSEETIIERLERLSSKEAESNVFRNCALIRSDEGTNSAMYALPGLRLILENGAIIGYELERDTPDALDLAHRAAYSAGKGFHDGTYPREVTVEVKILAKKKPITGTDKQNRTKPDENSNSEDEPDSASNTTQARPDARRAFELPLIGSLEDTVPYMLHESFLIRLVGEYFQAYLRNEKLRVHVKKQKDLEVRRELMNQSACLTLYLGCLRDRAKRLGIDFSDFAAPMAPVEDR